jgi:hypothetical protein
MPKVPTVKLVETKVDKAEEPNNEEIMKMLEILNPPTEAAVPKVQMGSVVTPKRRRMANVLDVVFETIKTLSPVPTRKIAEASKAQLEADTKQAKVEAATIQAETEASNKSIDYIIRHASGKVLSQEEMLEARHYSQKLKYPKGH